MEKQHVMKMVRYAATSLLLLICAYLGSCKRQIIQEFHVFEINEILLTAEDHYDNPYTDVECWVDLEGPGFDKRLYGDILGFARYFLRSSAAILQAVNTFFYISTNPFIRSLTAYPVLLCKICYVVSVFSPISY